MTLREIIRKAVSTRDFQLVRKIVVYLAQERGLNYIQTHAYVNNVIPIDIDTWEEMVYESEYYL